VVRRVISEETAKKVTTLLKTTTEKGGTGEGAVPAGYEVAGKTGTAQRRMPRLEAIPKMTITAGLSAWLLRMIRRSFFSL